MIDISFELNGRKVRPDQVGNALERAALDSIKKQIIQKVGAIRDPETGQPPKITVKGNSIDNLSFEISGSEQLIETVKKKLS